MYENFYQLRAEPFRLSPDHRFCFSHRSYAKAKAYMQYALHRAEGFVMITGRPGTGKTTLVNDLLDGLSRAKVTVAMLVTTQLEANDLLRMVAYSFGLDADAPHKATILQNLTLMLTRHHRERKRALLIIDEAQDLSSSALEELRLLTNLQLNNQPLLQIFLLGQEALRDLVQEPGMEQVHQRLVAACHLEPLKDDETRAYIKHRLERVGWKGDPAISEAVFPLIYKFSHGVPRRINLVCSRLFLHGSVEERHAIDIEDARTVIAELQQEQLMPLSIQEDPEFSMPEIEELSDDDLSVAGSTSTDEAVEGAAPGAVPPPIAHDGAAAIAQQQAASVTVTAPPQAEAAPAPSSDEASPQEPPGDTIAVPAETAPEAPPQSTETLTQTSPPTLDLQGGDQERSGVEKLEAVQPIIPRGTTEEVRDEPATDVNAPIHEQVVSQENAAAGQGDSINPRHGLITMAVLVATATALVIATLFIIKPAVFVALISGFFPDDDIALPQHSPATTPSRNHATAQDIHTGTIIRQPVGTEDNAEAASRPSAPTVPVPADLAAPAPAAEITQTPEDPIDSGEPMLGLEQATASPTQTHPATQHQLIEATPPTANMTNKRAEIASEESAATGAVGDNATTATTVAAEPTDARPASEEVSRADQIGDSVKPPPPPQERLALKADALLSRQLTEAVEEKKNWN